MGWAIFDVEKFDGTGDYFLWKKKMRVIMMQIKVDAALNKELELPATINVYEKKKMFKSA